MPKKSPTKRKSTSAITFFKENEAPLKTVNINFSAMFNLARFFSLAVLFRAVQAYGPPNPLQYIHDGSAYVLETSPSDLSSYPHVQSAYNSIADKLLNGTLGAITQFSSYVPNMHSVWSKEECRAFIGLSTNDTQAAIAVFLGNFTELVKNDSAFQAAEKYCNDHTSLYIVLGVIFGGVGLCIALLAIGAICAHKNGARSSYDSIGDNGNEVHLANSETRISLN